MNSKKETQTNASGTDRIADLTREQLREIIRNELREFIREQLKKERKQKT